MDDHYRRNSNMTEYAKKVALTVLIIIAFMVIPYIIYKIFPHFLPFILAYFTAVLLEPLNYWLARKAKLHRVGSVTASYLIFLATISLLGYFIVNKIYKETIGFIGFIQKNSYEIQIWFLNLTRDIQHRIELFPPETSAQINKAIIDFVNNLTNFNFVSKVGGYTYSLSTAIPNFFFLVIIYFISVYLMSYKLETIHRGFYSLFKESSKKKVYVVMGDLRNATIGFLKAQVILSTVTYILSFVGLTILGVKYAIVIALFIIIVDILPILGAGSVLTPWAIISFIQGNIFLGIGLLILFILIVIVRKAIEPKVLGERIGLSALATLISIWIGFKVMGVLGIFLFPVGCILYKALVKVGLIRFNFKL